MTKFGKIAVSLIIVLIIAGLSVPKLLSTTYVKQRIADQLSELSGRHVELTGSSSISLRPYLGVSYNDVVFSDPEDAEGKPLVSIEELKAKLDLFAALFGEANLSQVEFIRPYFRLRVGQNGQRNWLPDKGLLGKQIASEEEDGSLRLGTVKIEDGIVELSDEQSRQSSQLTAVNGQIFWPKSDAPAKINMESVWNGEIMKVSASFADPIVLLRGGTSTVSLNVNSKPIKLILDGEADSTGGGIEGSLSLNTPSPSRLVDWLGWNLPVARMIGELSINGDASLLANSLEFLDASVTVDGHQGVGRLQLVRQIEEVYEVTGTLAFKSIELPAMQYVLAPTGDVADSDAKPDLSFADNLVLDVRLSSEQASSGSLAMSNLAAAAIVRDGRASFDIGAAEAIGGTVAGSVSIRAMDDLIEAAADFALSDIDLEQLTQAYKGTAVSLQGKGDADFKLKSTGRDLNNLIVRLNGEGSIRGKDGELFGLDFPNLLANIGDGSDSVVRVSDGSTSYDELKLGFFVANGTAFLRDSSLKSSAIDLTLKGRTDLVRRSLALRGTIAVPGEENADSAELPFFVGGTDTSPLFVPLPAARLQQPPPEQPKAAQTSPQSPSQ